MYGIREAGKITRTDPDLEKIYSIFCASVRHPMRGDKLIELVDENEEVIIDSTSDLPSTPPEICPYCGTGYNFNYPEFHANCHLIERD